VAWWLLIHPSVSVRSDFPFVRGGNHECSNKIVEIRGSVNKNRVEPHDEVGLRKALMNR
jgi:hypothetical protein